MILTVANRLAKHAPFDRLEPELLKRVSGQIRIRYLEPDEVVFEAGEAPKPEFYVVVKGEVAVTSGARRGIKFSSTSATAATSSE